MLNELIDKIGYENMLTEILRQINMKNSFCVRIPLDRELDFENDILPIKDEENIPVSKLSLLNWFKKMEFYTNYIGSNKALIQGSKYNFPKKIMTNQINGIIFNYKGLIDKYDTINDIIIKTKNMIQEFSIVCGDEEKFNYYEKNIETIINKHQEFGTLDKIKIFLDEDLEIVKQKSIEYLSNNIFDTDNGVDENNKKIGRASLFYTLNSKKPLLKNNSNILSEDVILSNIDDAIKLYYLKWYLKLNTHKNLSSEVGNIQYDIILTNKKFEIDNYNNNPYIYKDVFEDNNLYIGKTIIKSNEDFNKYMYFLTDGKIKKYYGDKDNTDGKFKTFSKLYFEPFYNLNKGNAKLFKTNFERMLRALYNLYKRDFSEENQYKISDIIEFEISIRDYFFNKNLKGEINIMRENIISKIKLLENNKDYKIENDDEFNFICGQLASYLKKNTQTTNKTNQLFTRYVLAKNLEQIVQLLKLDMQRNDTKTNMFGRSNAIMTGILDYYMSNTIEFKQLTFELGLRSRENIIYTKNDEKVVK